jgi:hypothetical protein
VGIRNGVLLWSAYATRADGGWRRKADSLVHVATAVGDAVTELDDLPTEDATLSALEDGLNVFAHPHGRDLKVLATCKEGSAATCGSPVESESLRHACSTRQTLARAEA